MRTQVEIAFQFNLNTQITPPATPVDNQANVSHIAKIYDTKNYAYKGFRGFNFAGTKDQWSALADGTYKYYPDTGYNGYMSSTLSAADGTTDIALQFFVGGDVPDTLYLAFDSVCNEYATQLKITNSQNTNVVNVNNISYLVMVPIKSLALTPSTDLSLTVQILKWNKPYKNIKITQISFTYVGVYTGSDIVSFECSENLFDKQLLIRAGICEQFADLKIYDRTNVLHEFAMQEILVADQQVTITAIDDVNSKTYVLGSFFVNNWDVQSTDSTVGISCKDTSLTFDKIYVSAMEVQTRTVDDMLISIFAQLKNNNWQYIDDATATYCKSISTPNNWFYTDTLMSTLIKVCLLGMLRIYWYIDTFIVARCY